MLRCCDPALYLLLLLLLLLLPLPLPPPLPPPLPAGECGVRCLARKGTRVSLKEHMRLLIQTKVLL